MKFWQRANSNWTHLSAVMTEGMPNLEIKSLRMHVKLSLPYCQMVDGSRPLCKVITTFKYVNLEMMAGDLLDPHVHNQNKK